MTDITAIGEILIDLTQTGTSGACLPVYTAFPGGAPANVAVAAARLGAKTAFIGKVGNDAWGKLLVDTMRQNGVKADGMVVSDDANTTLAVVSVAPGGERDFAFYRKGFADTLLRENEISAVQLKSTHFLHFGSVSLTDEPSRTATLHAAAKAKGYGAVITYDPNYRASLWRTLKDALHHMSAPLSIVDILKISDEELELLTGVTDAEQGTAILRERYGIPLILVTLGAAGAYFRHHDNTAMLKGFQVKVADTNGAGDTFFGAFLSGMCRLGKYRPDDLTDNEIYRLVMFANKAASITTSRSGAIPAMPTLDEVKL